jgi:hypothetical protein
MGHNSLEVVKLRLPIQLFKNATNVGKNSDSVARTAGSHADWQLSTGNPRHGFYYFKHRITMSITAIQRDWCAAISQVAERGIMGAGEIRDVNIVSDAGAVWTRIITAWFVPEIKDEKRIPREGKLVVTRTRDSGKTFDALTNGLPQSHAYDVVYRHGLALDEGGDRLAFGSTTGGLWVSEDQGDTWASVTHTLPPVYAVQFA